MSILIKGMEMPKNCWECEFNKTTLDRMDFCAVNGKTYNYGLPERPSDCPLTELPSAQPERKTGRWIDDCTCSVCHWIHEDSNGFALLTHYNYCPNCGTRMRSTE